MLHKTTKVWLWIVSTIVFIIPGSAFIIHAVARLLRGAAPLAGGDIVLGNNWDEAREQLIAQGTASLRYDFTYEWTILEHLVALQVFIAACALVLIMVQVFRHRRNTQQSLQEGNYRGTTY